jgi:hypothetical protein
VLSTAEKLGSSTNLASSCRLLMLLLLLLLLLQA